MSSQRWPDRPTAERTATDWVASLSPWPEEFGLNRMRELLSRLGEPQRRFAAVHVVGTNGKSTATRTVAALLRADGRRTGAYTSPHVGSWAERIWVDGVEADFERAVARVRGEAMAVGATQFETITAAAFAEFAERDVEIAAVEAGLGGRLDATNTIGAEVVLLTGVALEHTKVLGETTDEIAAEKLAVAHAARVVVLPDNTHQRRVPGSPRIVIGGAREAAEALLGHSIPAEVEVTLPGRLEQRGRELWDGAHTPDAAAWLRERLPRSDYVLCVSILRDKDVDGVLAPLAAAGRTLVATASSNLRALPARELAVRAEPYFDDVHWNDDPHAALATARALAGAGGPVLVTGSLYLLADLSEPAQKTYDEAAR